MRYKKDDLVEHQGLEERKLELNTLRAEARVLINSLEG